MLPHTEQTRSAYSTAWSWRLCEVQNSPLSATVGPKAKGAILAFRSRDNSPPPNSNLMYRVANSTTIPTVSRSI
ncbi:hypothetical protein AUEXF2481DRAFT_35956 [Aureobasidium subglaciale EXF-2481]|uniref:Uncharacterized protein n=1 Tax=Aureobasidium subglaciale (strain EXF-2481) TaxID=1043005 RepID=A0A074Z0X9_AURSE|nr:uncharacterized protein AUEXF2481DRAFT_35956 [Aureobasidium subglaciale EXF-2481]KER00028.1 hypothetical protein AUEXF2481DRAFT_35956 [Aureobasidium subglaciale EXF-2481]